MPMGLSNSAPVFERLMERVLSGLTWKTCLVYLDDIIIFSRTFENHLANLREVFERLKEAHLKLSPKKCNFSKTNPIGIRLNCQSPPHGKEKAVLCLSFSATGI
jgi:hypothetical protein